LTAAEEGKMKAIAEVAKRREVDIRFYGRVVDQFEHPVEGAEVILGVTQYTDERETWFTRVKELHVGTDSEGAFSILQERGWGLYLEDVRKEGHEFMLSMNRVRGYTYSGEEKVFVPDPSAPVVFRLRKKGAETFLLQNARAVLRTRVADSGVPVCFDFVEDALRGPGAYPTPGKPFACDLQMNATYSPGKEVWRVVLAPGNGEGGIIVTEDLLFEAPETGYQPEFTFVADERDPPKYIYLQSRTPTIYTRWEIKYMTATREFFRLTGDAVTNPYGDRNLEPAVDLPSGVLRELRQSAKEALRRGERPPKPDLSALRNAAREAAK
jgi:hypothetical protein